MLYSNHSKQVVYYNSLGLELERGVFELGAMNNLGFRPTAGSSRRSCGRPAAVIRCCTPAHRCSHAHHSPPTSVRLPQVNSQVSSTAPAHDRSFRSSYANIWIGYYESPVYALVSWTMSAMVVYSIIWRHGARENAHSDPWWP